LDSTYLFSSDHLVAEGQNIALENGDTLNLPVLEDRIVLNGEVKWQDYILGTTTTGR
jgi:hypothetical protein